MQLLLRARSFVVAAATLSSLLACSGTASTSVPTNVEGGRPPPAPGTGDAPPAATVPPSAEAPAARLLRYLEGRFDTAAQSKSDREYFDITLTHCRLELPALGRDVLYVEQAVTETLARPYRQRIYVLEAVEDGARSRIFEARDPRALVGLCEAPAQERRVSAEDLEEKLGCEVTLNWIDGESAAGGTFAGGTKEGACPSSRDGASYTTSLVEVTELGISSWDRGFDAKGAQVWGATKGPYRFVRKTPLSPPPTP